MCGIAGFSLAEGSSVNARLLSHYLLAEITSRGQMAAGFGYATADGMGFHKAAEPGKSLKLRGMPRNAGNVVLHTRQATHGPTSDNRNNHPVMSPSGDMMLTHNGVIYNYDDVITDYLEPSVAAELPPVDTAVIPAVLEKYGVDGLKYLGGYAAIAWLDAKEGTTLNLARITTSPVAFTYLLDGSFVYASTFTLLKKALKDADLEHGDIWMMDEYEHFKIDKGIVLEQPSIPKSEYKGRDLYSSYSSITSGGKASGKSESTYVGFGAWRSSWDSYDDVAPSDDQILEWFQGGTTGSSVEEPKFYTVDSLGEFKHYYTIGGLVNDLMWHSRPAASYADPFENGDLLWTSHFRDVGSMDGETALSWFQEPSEIWAHEPDTNEPVLGFIRDGIAAMNAFLVL